MIKEEIRILGVDDSPFEKNQKGKIPVVGVIYRGGKIFDGMLLTRVKVDGMDATTKLAELLLSTRHRKQLKVLMLDGITLAGFNLVDLEELHAKTRLPLIAINRKIPDLRKVKAALKKFPDFERRWKVVERAGMISACKLNGKKIYYQSKGLQASEAEEIIRLSCTRGFIPEPLRVAHLVATALVKGESYGRA